MPYSKQFQQPFKQQQATNSTSGLNTTNNSMSSSTSFGTLSVGARVVVVDGGKVGIIRFLGPVHFKEGIWCGIELDLPIGKNNGTVYGVCYFTCKPNHGLFVSPTKVSLLTGSSSAMKVGGTGSNLLANSNLITGSSQLLRTPAEIVRMTPFVDYTPMEVEYRQRSVASSNKPFGASGNMLGKSYGEGTTTFNASSSLRPIIPTANEAGRIAVVNPGTPQKYHPNSVSSTPTITVPPSSTSKYSSSAYSQLKQENERNKEEIVYLKGQISTYLVQLNEQKLAFNDFKRTANAETDEMLTRITGMISDRELVIYEHQETMSIALQNQQQLNQQIEMLKGQLREKEEEVIKLQNGREDLELLQEKVRSKEDEINRLNYALQEIKAYGENETTSLQSTINQYKLSLSTMEQENQSLLQELNLLRKTKSLPVQLNSDNTLLLQQSNDQLTSKNEVLLKNIQQLEKEIVALKQSNEEIATQNYTYLLTNQQLTEQLTTSEVNNSKVSGFDNLQRENEILKQELNNIQLTKSIDNNSLLDELTKLKGQVEELKGEKRELLNQMESTNLNYTEIQNQLREERNLIGKQNSLLQTWEKEIEKVCGEKEQMKTEFTNSLDLLKKENSHLQSQIISIRKELQEKDDEIDQQSKRDSALQSKLTTKQTSLDNALQSLTNSTSTTTNINQIQQELEQNISMIQNVINLTNGNRIDIECIAQLLNKIDQDKNDLMKEIGNLVSPQQLTIDKVDSCGSGSGEESLQQIQSIVDGLEKNNNYDKELLNQIFNSLKNDFCLSCNLPGHLAENCYLTTSSTKTG